MTQLVSPVDAAKFRRRLVAWQARHGRHDLPWQQTRDAYRIWVSEIMLQQTQVATVIPRYQAFMRRFPTVEKLAAAPADDVMALWAGLGYYARARNLHRAAEKIVASHGGQVPRDAATLQTLPGIGRSTAAAIAVFSSGARAAILDGNVKRVLSRVFMVGAEGGAAATERKLWALAGQLLPARHLEAYTQGLMDLGATTCTPRKPDCERCPLASMCGAARTGRIAEFPQRAARPARPRKSCQMIVALFRGKVLLEKRPPRGIWGGLWSLPEVECGKDAVAALETRTGAAGRLVGHAEPIGHEFTHFSLDIHPAIVRVLRGASEAGKGPGWKWVGHGDLGEIGVPTPVDALIRKYAP